MQMLNLNIFQKFESLLNIKMILSSFCSFFHILEENKL